jgi:cellulose synthase/poly-beta-1,6-N-acetylglucosamine synthase-like glycosyltransferase
MPDRARIFLIIPTHTTRHLDRCLGALARQERSPDGVVLSCDNDDASILDLAASTWRRARAVAPLPPLVATQRPFTGRPSLNQVRNNGLRAMDRACRPSEHDLVVMLDGDTMLDENALARHAHLLESGADLVVPYRVNLDERQSDGIDLDRLFDESSPLQDVARADQMEALRRRHRRYARQLLVKRAPLGRLLVKAHKPKVLGGHHAVRIAPLRAVNAYDEAYLDYGYDDDDLARRLHALRPRIKTAIAVTDCLAYHLWHPSRAPQSPTAAPGHARFATRGLPVRAELGWDAPAPQDPPTVTTLD